MSMEAFQCMQENAAAMEEKDFQLVRSLIKLAQASENPKVLAVAVNDLGMFIDANPHGRFIVNDLGGKGPVMGLMQHPSPEVQKCALLCVQRLMLGRDKLDFLRRPAPAASRPQASTSV
jgi:V-type H+-transporting ATPase subunit H